MKVAKAFALIIFALILFYAVYVLSQSSIQFDNAQTLWIVSHSVPTILRLSVTMSTGPLYYLVVHVWIIVFGNTLLSIHMLSITFFILSVVSLYDLARDLGTKTFAFTTIILFALSPLVIYYSFAGGIYMMITYLTILNHRSFLKMISTHGREGKVGYILSTVLGLYTHYILFLLLGAQLLYLLIKGLTTLSSRTKVVDIPNTGSRIFFVYLFIILFTLPLIYYVTSVGGFVFPTAVHLNQTSVIQTFFYFFTGYQTSESTRFIIAFWPLLGILIFFVFTQGKRIAIQGLDYFMVITFLPLAGLFLVSFITALFQPQFIIFIAPSIFILLAVSLLRGNNSFPFSLITIVSGIMFLFLILQTVLPNTPVRADYESLSEFLATDSNFSDIIIVSPPINVYPIEYYYTGNAKVTTVPEWDFISGTKIPQYSHDSFVSAVMNYKQTYEYLYFVSTENNTSDQNDMKSYLQTHFELVNRKEYGPQVIVYKYRLRYY